MRVQGQLPSVSSVAAKQRQLTARLSCPTGNCKWCSGCVPRYVLLGHWQEGQTLPMCASSSPGPTKAGKKAGEAGQGGGGWDKTSYSHHQFFKNHFCSHLARLPNVRFRMRCDPGPRDGAKRDVCRSSWVRGKQEQSVQGRPTQPLKSHHALTRA